MDKEVMHTYELFLGRYVINDGRINKVVRYPFYACGGTCESGINGTKVIFCTSCKYPEGHYCYIDYMTGITHETRSPSLQTPYWILEARKKHEAIPQETA